MPLNTEVVLGPGDIVLDGGPPPMERGKAAPTFQPMSVVAKWSPISATAEHLFIFFYFHSLFTLYVFNIKSCWLIFEILHL